MPTTDAIWLKLAYWLMQNPNYSAKSLVELLRDRYPLMTDGQAWTEVVRYRNERHSLQEKA